MGVTAGLLVLTLVGGCGEIPPPQVRPVPALPTISGTPSYRPALEPAAAVLPFIPLSATSLTVTDFDKVRAQLGVPDLTSDDLMADRAEFWRRAEVESPMLTQGLLREDTSELMLDFGFTQDDVDWEAHFSGPEGSGFVLGFRDDLDMFTVTRAVAHRVGPLAGVTVLPREHLVVSEVAEDGAESWATNPALVDLVDQSAQATYVERACVPLDVAVGPGASRADQDAAQLRRDPANLQPLDAFAVAFGDHLATVRMDGGRSDLFDRLHLGDTWPAIEGAAFSTGFAHGVADPTTGRIGYEMPRPAAAARLTMLQTLPFALCSEGASLPEPAGL